MTSALDMSLDDIIKSNKKSSSSGRGSRGGRGSALGPARHTFKRGVNRTAPYSKPVQAPQAAWQHSMFINGVAAAAAARSSSLETDTKLYISNLDYSVSNEDIKELFSEVGDLKRYSVHFDRSGRSKGTAEVVFGRRTDAVAAVKRYNNVQLDGKPMKIEIIGTPAAVPPTINGMYGNQNGASRSSLSRGGAIGRPRLGARGARGDRGGRGGRGRGRVRGATPNISLEDLDADLEKYHEEAKQLD